MFKKIDQSFERAAMDPAERLEMLRRLKRRRKLGVWVVTFGFVLCILAPVISASPALISLESLEFLNGLLRIMPGFLIGVFVGMILIHQDIKMLTLCHGAPLNPLQMDRDPGQQIDVISSRENNSPDP